MVRLYKALKKQVGNKIDSEGLGNLLTKYKCKKVPLTSRKFIIIDSKRIPRLEIYICRGVLVYVHKLTKEECIEMINLLGWML